MDTPPQSPGITKEKLPSSEEESSLITSATTDSTTQATSAQADNQV